MRARLERRDTLLEQLLLLDFSGLPVGSQEMLLWAALDSDGERWLQTLSSASGGADSVARQQLARLVVLHSGKLRAPQPFSPTPLHPAALLTLRQPRLVPLYTHG